MARYIKNNQKGHRQGEIVYKPSIAERAFELCLLGLRNTDLAIAFGVKAKTIENWLKTKPRFAEKVKAGRLEADAKVAKSMYQRAIGYSHPDSVILTNRVDHYDDSGKKTHTTTEPLIVNVIKHYPPDAYAANKWLSIRQRELWADVQRTEHTHTFQGSLDVNHMLKELSDTSKITDAELKMALALGIDKAKGNISDN